MLDNNLLFRGFYRLNQIHSPHVRLISNKVPVSSGQCQVFDNEFILLDQATCEFYLLNILSSIT